MSLVRWLLWQHRAWLVAVLLLSSLSASLGVVVIAFINDLIASPKAAGRQLAPQFVGLIAALFATGVASQLIVSVLGHRSVYRLRRALVKRVLDASVERLEQLGISRLLTSLNSDTSHITAAFVGLPALVYGGLVCAGGLGYLAWLSPRLFGAVLGWIFATLAGAWVLLRRTHHHVDRARQAEERLYEDYRTAVEGRKELQFNRPRAKLFYEGEFDHDARQNRDFEILADVFNVLNDNWVNCMALGAVALSLGLGRGLGWAPADTATTFALTVLYLRTPLTGVMSALPALVQGGVALEKVRELELPAYDASFETQGAPLPDDWRTLRLEGVRYRYPSSPTSDGFELGPIDLSIERGQVLFIVGGNGSGKSSLARVLSGLYPRTGGRIWLDDRALEEAQLPAYRALFSSVFSDFWLFRQTLDESGIAPAEVARAWLSRLELDQKTSVEAGRLTNTALSQGQRKRLALVVALLENRPILLLDEWAADQDPSFRHQFYTELLPALKAAGKTVIAISHDDRYFYVADRVYSAEWGKLSELRSPLAAAPGAGARHKLTSEGGALRNSRPS